MDLPEQRQRQPVETAAPSTGVGGSRGAPDPLMKGCRAEDEQAARRLAHELWPNSGSPGELAQELPTPKHFEQASSLVNESDVADPFACGPEPERWVASIQESSDPGCDEVDIQQIGVIKKASSGSRSRAPAPPRRVMRRRPGNRVLDALNAPGTWVIRRASAAWVRRGTSSATGMWVGQRLRPRNPLRVRLVRSGTTSSS